MSIDRGEIHQRTEPAPPKISGSPSARPSDSSRSTDGRQIPQVHPLVRLRRGKITAVGAECEIVDLRLFGGVELREDVAVLDVHDSHDREAGIKHGRDPAARMKGQWQFGDVLAVLDRRARQSRSRF